MKITFLGAAHEVTGSSTLLEAAGHRILIDCGMEQGQDIFENCTMPVAAKDVDCVVLTHAHIDHSGLLPRLYRDGFFGQIYATDATSALCRIMLQDAAYIQESEAVWRNRKNRRSGKPDYEPLYTVTDALETCNLFAPMGYEDTAYIFPEVRLRFVDAGHLLGSASAELIVTEGDETCTFVFSGDIGNKHQPLLKDPTLLTQADVVVMESTYGDRSHDLQIDYLNQLTPIIQSTLDAGGNVVIPAFAVGRAQELLFFIRQIKQDGLIKGHDHFPVYLDSPLAVEATQIFTRDMTGNFDEETQDLLRQGINPINFPDLSISISADDSIAINNDPTPKVIISASGMCEAGRIRHHLKHNLWRPECTILFVGYQAAGTTGRSIVEGAEKIRLFDEEIVVRARIAQLAGISGHADQNGLMEWIQAYDPKPRIVFVNHGEDAVCTNWARRLTQEEGFFAIAPYNGASYDPVSGACLVYGNDVPIKREAPAPKRSMNPVYQQLLDALERLKTVVSHNEGGANKDLKKFTQSILSLCDKWDR